MLILREYSKYAVILIHTNQTNTISKNARAIEERSEKKHNLHAANNNQTKYENNFLGNRDNKAISPFELMKDILPQNDYEKNPKLILQ